ncbi:hypothetical protein [Dactylosporangium sp. NPDC049140]|uniref:hypothetical protein n=1 Tax=Dactylosporangium sp. NPDC049140 TaxID=3155647 RepID=UPI0033DC945A
MINLLTKQGAVAEVVELLKALASAGNENAGRRLADLFATEGRLDELRQLADGGNTHAARRLGRSSLGQTPDYRSFTRLHGSGSQAALYRQLPETVGWIALTMAGGVVGNGAYDALKAAVSRGLRQIRKPDEMNGISGVEGEAVETEFLAEEDAFSIACAAIDGRCREVRVDPPDPESLRYSAILGEDGRWLLMVRDGGGRVFHVRISPRRPGGSGITLTLYFPASAAGRSRRTSKEWPP